MDKRGSSLGYGKKTSFEAGSIGYPSPNTYNMKSIFEKNKHFGYSFGLSRIAVEKRYLASHPPKDFVIPGPGAYKHKEVFGKGCAVYSISSKAASNYQGRPIKVHGPGAYEALAATEREGKHFVSKFKDSGAQNFNPPSSKRFFDISIFDHRINSWTGNVQS